MRVSLVSLVYSHLFTSCRGKWRSGGGRNAFKMHLKPHKRKRILIGTHSRASFLLHGFKFRICLDTIRTKADSALSCNTQYVATQFQGVDKTAKKKGEVGKLFPLHFAKVEQSLEPQHSEREGGEVEG